jgi:hypothetical protein
LDDLSGVMTAVRDQLAAVAPARVVTRSYTDFARRPDEDLVAGVFTVISRGEGSYDNVPGRAAGNGTQRILIVGQVRVGEDEPGAAVEDAEFGLVADLKALARSDLPEIISGLALLDFEQSRQLEQPYGWVAAELENQP